jgi:hypothetical protein
MDIKTKHNITLTFQLILGLGILVLLLRNPKQVYPVSTQKTIEHRIQGKETVIETQTIVANNDKKIIATLTAGLSDLEKELEKVRNSRDTFNIVQIQDTMIHVLYARDKFKDDVIARQDTIILAQRYIIDSKDTIITTQKFDIKKLKRQRLGLSIYGLLMTGVAILK